LNWWKFDPNLTHPATLPEATRVRLPRAGPGAELRAPMAPAKVAAKRPAKKRKKS
jgi:hypothetical protein